MDPMMVSGILGVVMMVVSPLALGMLVAGLLSRAFGHTEPWFIGRPRRQHRQETSTSRSTVRRAGTATTPRPCVDLGAGPDGLCAVAVRRVAPLAPHAGGAAAALVCVHDRRGLDIDPIDAYLRLRALFRHPDWRVREYLATVLRAHTNASQTGTMPNVVALAALLAHLVDDSDDRVACAALDPFTRVHDLPGTEPGAPPLMLGLHDGSWDELTAKGVAELPLALRLEAAACEDSSVRVSLLADPVCLVRAAAIAHCAAADLPPWQAAALALDPCDLVRARRPPA
jgi:hypothetical protein